MSHVTWSCSGGFILAYWVSVFLESEWLCRKTRVLGGFCTWMVMWPYMRWTTVVENVHTHVPRDVAVRWPINFGLLGWLLLATVTSQNKKCSVWFFHVELWMVTWSYLRYDWVSLLGKRLVGMHGPCDVQCGGLILNRQKFAALTAYYWG